MQSLAFEDVQKIAELIGAAGNAAVVSDGAVGKRRLLEGLAKLVQADAYMWNRTAFNPNDPNDAMALSVIDGGWRDELQRVQAFEALTTPAFTQPMQVYFLQAMREQRFVSLSRAEIFSDEQWIEVGGPWRKSGLEYVILTGYPLSSISFSGVGLYRNLSGEDFTPRDRAIIEIVLKNVDWLHRHGTDEPLNEKVVQLSPRQRQVLTLLLAGESQKKMAELLELSAYTVGDYIKQLHKMFGVSSRAELQGIFHAGRN